MIIVSECVELIGWLEENRPDKGSDIPYVRPIEIANGYQLPQNAFIEKGLNSIGQQYSIVFTFNGNEFTVDSTLFKQS